jgi:hypothetical protein
MEKVMTAMMTLIAWILIVEQGVQIFARNVRV